MYRKIATTLIFVCMLGGGVRPAYAGVLVTEIAWMGTASSANDEWIEIHNDGSDAVDLSGWSLVAEDGTPSIDLSGSIGPDEYKLLERTDDSSYPGITALLVYTGALSNDGENLTLYEGGVSVQDINFAGGWPAGDSTTKETMQWTGSSWVTAPETAGAETVESDDGGDGNQDGGDDSGDDNSGGDGDDESQVVTKTSADKVSKTKIFDDRIFELEYPKQAVAGSPVYFKAQALDYDRSKLIKGLYVWNMGDGTVLEYSRQFADGRQDFNYTYMHAGTYAVSLKYYETYFEGVTPDVEENFKLEVAEAEIKIINTYVDGSIELQNDSSKDIALDDWRINDNFGKFYIFPDDSKILAGKTMVVSHRASRLDNSKGVALLTPTSILVSRFPEEASGVNNENDTSNKEEATVGEGEVLGASTYDAGTEDGSPLQKPGSGQNGLVWILAFVVLILISVIAVLFLKKEEISEEAFDYELLDE